jgi:excisionase family DNA binding protein
MKTVYIDRPLEPMIGANEAAEYLGFSSTTVRRMAHRGELPSYAFPRGNGKFLHRYRVSDLKEYLDALKRFPAKTVDQERPENLAYRLA